MSEQELVIKVKELHVLSLTCATCGHGTIFDFNDTQYLEKMVTPKCCVCLTEMAVDLQEQLKAYRCFYDSMSRCERVEFRMRLNKSEPASVSEVQQVVSTAVAEVENRVSKALAMEHGSADLVSDGRFAGFRIKN